ncbi:MAG: hypothetical protein J6U42_03760 [Lachnospiraceae bacterium]|nr:hypothetical protein [Lachnospiraceae bacterium]
MSHQMIFQKITTIFSLAAAVVFFVLGLGYSTDLYTLFYFIDPTSFMYVDGSRIYYDVQDFNRTEVLYAVILIVLAALCFMMLNNSRRKYYVTNFVSSGLFAGFSGFLSWYVYTNSLKYKEQFLTTVDFDTWKMWVEMFPNDFKMTTSTLWFDLGVVSAVIGVIAVVLVIVNVVWKVLWMAKENEAMKALKNARPEVQR